MADSPGVRTRRQAAQAANQEAEKPMNGHAVNGAVTRGIPLPSKSTLKSENVFLFWPNIIGYSRIILAIASLYYMPLHPRTCSLLYSISCLLDALDGVAARYFGQSTQFGAVLDMVTDRCTTACLLVFLSSAWPRWALLFQGLISLDLASHYMHMYATLTMGGGGASHKKVEAGRSWVLNIYYTNKNVLFAFCALNELFFIALYLLSFSSPTLSPSLLLPPSVGGRAVGGRVDASSSTSSSFSSSPQPIPSTLFAAPGSAYAMELARANKMDSFWPWVLAGISAPVMAGKQVINVVQLVKASKWLAEGDVAERERRRGKGGEGAGKRG